MDGINNKRMKRERKRGKRVVMWATIRRGKKREKTDLVKILTRG